jgi:hypothetical protein
MTTVDHLRRWNETGILDNAQHETLTALVRRERFSVFLELSAGLYLGVLALTAGLTWTFQAYFTTLGDVFIISVLSLLFAGCLAYCLSRSLPWAPGQVESPDLALDYVLYLGCLTLSAQLTYLTFRFPSFQSSSDDGLLLLVAVYALFAYRFDNRFVLSLALTSLAAWSGLKLTGYGFRSADALRTTALAYGAFVSGAGAALHKRGVKPHFLGTYLHIAANVVLSAVAFGVRGQPYGPLYVVLLALLSSGAVVLGVRHSRFAFVAYGVGYGYAGLSYLALAHVRGDTAVLGYFAVTGTLMIAALVVLARQFGRSE